MEKRFVVFIVLTMLVLTGHVFIQSMIAPPPPPVAADGDEAAVEGGLGQELAVVEKQAEEAEAQDASPPEVRLRSEDAADETREAVAGEQPQPPAAQEWITIGSYDGSAGPLLVTLTTKGAGVVRVELVERSPNGKLKYKNLLDKSGYLGHLALTSDFGKGCRVNALGRGTPAAVARATAGELSGGLQVGDIITAARRSAGEAIETFLPSDLELFLEGTRAGDSIQLDVVRQDNAATIRFDVALGERPLQVIRPEPLEGDETQPHPISCLFSLSAIGGVGAMPQLVGPLSPREGNWEVQLLDETDPAGPLVEFRFPLSSSLLESVGREGNLELVKRFRLGSGEGEGEEGLRNYHLDLEVEIVNRGQVAQQVQYQLDGPNGLPLEGWWYSYKTHPGMFKAAGARDVLLKKGGKRATLEACPDIYKRVSQRPENPKSDLLNEIETINYMAVDTQYFVSALIPAQGGADFSRASAVALGQLRPKRLQKTTNISFELESPPTAIPPESSIAQRFELFVGPKRPEVLAQYGLDEAVYYGWPAFAAVARPLSATLHFFYALVGNYGIAIIMLTILVRGAMFPLSRKAAKNAAMMQELAPEMKAITEKYKKDMEKRAKAQQELFRRNNYNPLGGCWVMFLQLPIFIGLYRSLSVDVELRQAALIPGWDWCSNLAGPDQLFYWGDVAFLGLFEKTGMLGPYFNILPLGTVALFLVQQKMFTPPATDEQTRMQLQVMKFMTLFIGIMFFKVASGLCLYFIASSIWGIAERKLLPKKKVDPAAAAVIKEAKPEPRQRPASRNGPNGSAQQSGSKGKKRSKRR